MNTIVRNPKLSFGRMILVGIAAALPFVTQASEPASNPPNEPTRLLRIASSIEVSYTDLDLADPAAASTLYARLKMASRKVCGHRPPPLGISAVREYRDCYESTLTNAVNRVNNRQLYALHAEHGRKTTMG